MMEKKKGEGDCEVRREWGEEGWKREMERKRQSTEREQQEEGLDKGSPSGYFM